MIRPALLFLILQIGAAGLGADASAKTKTYPVPVVTAVAGRPATATWPDGNQAEIRVNRNPVVWFAMNFEVTENLCTAPSGSRFSMNFAARVSRIGWIWTHHSDPGKLGHVLVLREDSIAKGFPLLTEFTQNNAESAAPDLGPALPKDEIHFTDLTWIPELRDGALKPFAVDAWNAERMLPNSQTGLSENRIVRTLSGVHFTPQGPNTATLTKTDGVAIFLPSIFPMGGDAVSWILKDQGQNCQITLKTSASDTMAAYRKYLDSLPPDFTSYNWQEDRLSKIAEGFIMSFVVYAEE